MEAAHAAGIDIEMLQANLALTPEQRVRQHDQALALVLAFDEIRRRRDAHAQRPA